MCREMEALPLSSDQDTRIDDRRNFNGSPHLKEGENIVESVDQVEDLARKEEEVNCIINYLCNSVSEEIMNNLLDEIIDKDELDLQKKMLSKITGAPTNGASGGLSIIYDPCCILFSFIESHNNWMSGRVTSLKNNLDFVIINVYGPILNEDKQRVWEEIENFIDSLHEKQGGLGINAHASLDFAIWIHRSGMSEINMVQEAFT
ncbi:hypothetical protein SUGI_0927260 [Cryptomeria japonica]|nr:hypothetical protein SUGI_0927260 [Cryptomeria japonica]